MNQKAEVALADLQKLDIRVGTIVEAKANEKARNPAYVLRIDLGDLGIATSSAQITENYRPAELIGTQVVVLANLPPRRVAGVRSEVLVLAGVAARQGTVLLQPRSRVDNGTEVA